MCSALPHIPYHKAAVDLAALLARIRDVYTALVEPLIVNATGDTSAAADIIHAWKVYMFLQ